MFVIVVYSAPATLEIRRQQRQIFIFSFGGGGGGLISGGAAACFGRDVVATPGKVKEKV